MKKLSPFAVYNIKSALSAGESGKSIARRYKVHHSSIYDIKEGRTHCPKRIAASKISQRMKMQGENAPSAKLSSDDVLKIKMYYNWGWYTQADLAAMYGVTNQNISLIVNEKTWNLIQ